jgi:3-phosphoshikimate 1-carboxyvinyltransferase
MHGLAELRVKESDRLAAIAGGLRACGIAAEESAAGLIVGGAGGRPPGGGTIAVERDHRIAMAFLVLGLAAEKPVRIDDGAAIATSFPGFAALLGALGAGIEPARPA